MSWRLILVAMAAGSALIAPHAKAAGLDAALQAELRRGLAAADFTASDEPALRLERKSREPSAGFALGAALGAWMGAAAALDFDLKNPSGDGDDSEAIGIDCYDEKTAFAHLEARRQSLALTVQQVLDASGVGRRQASAWTDRVVAGPAACR